MRHFTKKSWNVVIGKNKPTGIVHCLTNRCNARCPHCFIDFNNKQTQKSFMNLEDIDKLTKTMGDQLINVNLSGGEPFLVKDILDIARYYYKNTSIESILYFHPWGIFQ